MSSLSSGDVPASESRMVPILVKGVNGAVELMRITQTQGNVSGPDVWRFKDDVGEGAVYVDLSPVGEVDEHLFRDICSHLENTFESHQKALVGIIGVPAPHEGGNKRAETGSGILHAIKEWGRKTSDAVTLKDLTHNIGQ